MVSANYEAFCRAGYRGLKNVRSDSGQKLVSQFRDELKELQDVLKTYSKMLSDMAGVEDLTELEDNNAL